ncbi:MAG: DUF6174 domain-containing protein [Spirochaetaceae bacterium]|jgi:hypothetical protein|nr:DUF6174 domain-containing protein [Spirochaetaceae bacterium]
MAEHTMRFHWAMGLMCGILALSCEIQIGRGVQFDRTAFNRERALWEAQGISDYIFTEIYFPDNPEGNVRVTVSGNKAVKKESQDDDREGTLFADTISGIYEEIEKDAAYWEEELSGGQALYRSVNFSIEYDPTYHFPRKVEFAIVEPGLVGGWYDVTIEDFVTAETASRKQENFDIAAFNREKRRWADQNITDYTFTQVHESNHLEAPETIGFMVSISGTMPASGDWNDMGKGYTGSIFGMYLRILSEFQYWRSEMYKNDDYVSVDCEVSYNAVWHYPESLRFRVGLSSGESVRWANVDIVEFEKLE